jgi:hypothetical protein
MPYRGFDAAERNQKLHWNLLDLFGSFCIKAKTNKSYLQPRIAQINTNLLQRKTKNLNHEYSG